MVEQQPPIRPGDPSWRPQAWSRAWTAQDLHEQNSADRAWRKPALAELDRKRKQERDLARDALCAIPDDHPGKAALTKMAGL
jgi:hypothetical protein